MICFDSGCERALDDPVGCRLDRELDSRRVDHEADAAELVRGCGPQPRRPKCKRLGVRIRTGRLVMTANGSGPRRDRVGRQSRGDADARE